MKLRDEVTLENLDFAVAEFLSCLDRSVYSFNKRELVKGKLIDYDVSINGAYLGTYTIKDIGERPIMHFGSTHSTRDPALNGSWDKIVDILTSIIVTNLGDKTSEGYDRFLNALNERIKQPIKIEKRITDAAANSPLRIFLCYAHDDKPAVRELYQRLCADGIDAWLDEKNLLPGQDWQREIHQAVRKSDVVIVCLSRGSINKEGYVQKEIKFALDIAEEKPDDIIFLIPLKLEECDMLERLNRWHWVDYFNVDGYSLLMRSLRTRAPAAPL